jgi:iron complex outermembrane recepter protein
VRQCPLQCLLCGLSRAAPSVTPTRGVAQRASRGLLERLVVRRTGMHASHEHLRLAEQRSQHRRRGARKLDTQLSALTLKWQLPWAELKSVSSFQVLNHHQQEDGTRLDEATLGFFDHVEAWNTFLHDITQEVSLASRPGDAPVDWVAGVFYLHQTSHQYVHEVQGPPAFVSYENDAHIARVSAAGYGQVTLHVRDGLRLALGGRYNHDRYSGPSTTLGVTTSDVYSKAVPTGKAELQVDVGASNMAYLPTSPAV